MLHVHGLRTKAAGAVSTEASTRAKRGPVASVTGAAASTYLRVSMPVVTCARREGWRGIFYQFLCTLVGETTHEAGYMCATYQALAHPPFRQPMIPALQSVSLR